MSATVLPVSVYKASDDVVARKIAGEFVMIPIVSGIGSLEDELFSLNATGEAIWERLDGKSSIQEIVNDLADKYKDSVDKIDEDVKGLVSAFLDRGLVVEVASA